MKSNAIRKRLSLNRETLRQLTQQSLAEIGGGVRPPTTVFTVDLVVGGLPTHDHCSLTC